MPPCTTNAPGQSESFPPEISQPFPIDSGALCEDLADFVRHLKPLLTVSCEWLEQGVLEFIGRYPVAAGVKISAGSSKYKDSDFDIYTGSAGFLFPAG